MMVWTDADVARLAEMAAQGMTARKIAQELGITTNSVIGKCHRIGVQLLGKGGAPHKAEKRAADKTDDELPLFLPVFLPRREEIRPPGVGVRMEDLELDHCRWPLWGDERPTMVFCGLPRMDETVSYCRGHCQAAFAGRPSLRRASYVSWRR